jgi:hypothetical protein
LGILRDVSDLGFGFILLEGLSLLQGSLGFCSPN